MSSDSNVELQLVIGAAKRIQQALDMLEKDVEQSSGGLMAELLGNLENSIRAALSALGAWYVAELAKDSAVLAARAETLRIILDEVRNNAGYTEAQMEEYAHIVAKIRTESRRLINLTETFEADSVVQPGRAFILPEELEAMLGLDRRTAALIEEAHEMPRNFFKGRVRRKTDRFL